MIDGAVVAIDAEGSPPAAYVHAAIAGCAQALGPGRCVETDSERVPSPKWHAVIRYWPDADARRIVIDVERDGSLYGRRELEFGAEDAVETRWLSAGVVIAAVVSAELRQNPAPETPAEPEQKTPRAEHGAATLADPTNPVDAIDTPSQSLELWTGPHAFEFVGFAGTEVYRGPPELGAIVRAKLGLFETPFLLTGIGAAVVPGNPLIVQTDASAGLGLPIQLVGDDVGLDLGASFAVQWLWAQHRADSGRRDSVQHFRYGAGLDVDLRLRVSGCWAAVVGGHSTFLWPEVDIRRGLEQVAIVLPAAFGVAVGVRYDLREGC